jgi:hypothetical protein
MDNYMRKLYFCTELKQKLTEFNKEYIENKNKKDYSYTNLAAINNFTNINVNTYIELYHYLCKCLQRVPALNDINICGTSGGMFFKSKIQIQPIIINMINKSDIHITIENEINELKEKNKIEYRKNNNSYNYNIILNLFDLKLIVTKFLLNNCYNVLSELKILNNQMKIKKQFNDSEGNDNIDYLLFKINKLKSNLVIEPSILSSIRLNLENKAVREELRVAVSKTKTSVIRQPSSVMKQPSSVMTQPSSVMKQPSSMKQPSRASSTRESSSSFDPAIIAEYEKLQKEIADEEALENEGLRKKQGGKNIKVKNMIKI